MLFVRGMTRRLLILLLTLTAVCSVVGGAHNDSLDDPIVDRKKVIFAPAPVVPLEARLKHLGGSGVCAVAIRPDGSVSRAWMLVSTGHQILDDAATNAFSRWRFVPGATRPRIKIPITFSGNSEKRPFYKDL